MSIESRVRAALLPIVPIVESDYYMGKATTYIVFRFDEIPALHCRNRGGETRYLLSVSLYLPLRPTEVGESSNPRTLKRQIKTALEDAGCTTPTITDASDELGRLFVFECEAVENGL